MRRNHVIIRALIGLSVCVLVLVVLGAMVSAVTDGKSGGDGTSPPALARSQVDDVAELPRGVSLEHVRALLGPDPRHQFTSHVGGGEYVCVSYAFGEPYVRLYFLFRDGKLEKVSEPPPERYKSVPYRGGTLETRLPVDPNVRIAEAMQAPDLGPREVRASVAARLPKGRESLNVLPAYLAVSEQRAAAEPRRRKEYVRNEELAKHFDGRRVALGDTRATVDAALGQPTQSAGAGERVVCVYGSTEPLNLVNPAYLFSPVDVQFESGRVVAVFGNDFVNTVDGIRPKQ